MIKNNSERYIQIINKCFKKFYRYKKEHLSVVSYELSTVFLIFEYIIDSHTFLKLLDKPCYLFYSSRVSYLKYLQ